MWPIKICAAAMSCATITSLPRIDQVKSQRQSLTINQEMQISSDCSQLNANGKLLNIIDLIHQDSEKLKAIFKSNDLSLQSDNLNNIKANIDINTKKIINLTETQFVNPKWITNFSWEINLADFSDIDSEILNTNIIFLDFEINSLEFAGQEREDLYNLVSTEVISNVLKISYRQPQSSLDLCQLNPTLVISGNLILGFQGKKYHQNTILTVKPGVRNSKISNTSSKPENIKADKDKTVNSDKDYKDKIDKCYKPNDAPCSKSILDPRIRF